MIATAARAAEARTARFRGAPRPGGRSDADALSVGLAGADR